MLAGYLVAVIPLAIALTWAACLKRRWIAGLASGVATSILLLATILTGSRGGYIGLAAELLGFCLITGSLLWHTRPGVRPLVVLSVVLIPLLVVLGSHYIPSAEQRVVSMFAGREHSSNSYRLNVWSSSKAMFKDNWWFGIGVGNEAFRLAYGLYMTSGFDALGTYSVPLEVAVETGALGLACFALLLLAALCRGHINFWRCPFNWHSCLIAGAACALIGLIFHGFVDTVFYRPQVHLIFWLLVALLTTSGEDSQPGSN